MTEIHLSVLEAEMQGSSADRVGLALRSLPFTPK